MNGDGISNCICVTYCTIRLMQVVNSGLCLVAPACDVPG
jgi:hypothetical protein